MGAEVMIQFLNKFETYIVGALVGMMALVILISTLELGWIIIKDFLAPPRFLLEIADLLEIFGFFMLVLIGIELLESIKAYLKDHVIHIEIVLEVALIAIARKVIILDIEKYDGLTLVGTAGLILAVAVAFYAVKTKVLPKSS